MFKIKHLLSKIFAIIILVVGFFSLVFGADLTGIWKVDEEQDKAFAIVHNGNEMIIKEHVYRNGKLKDMIGSGKGEKNPRTSSFKGKVSVVKKAGASQRQPEKMYEFIPLQDGITMRVHWIDRENGEQGRFTLIKQSDDFGSKKDKKTKRINNQ